MNITIVSGQSGSGKSIALNALEDEGFYCIDNLPVGLLRSVVQNLCDNSTMDLHNVAVGIDARSGSAALHGIDSVMAELRDAGHRVVLVYLQARDTVLVKRYSETRRKHPLTSGGLSLVEAIAREKTVLAEVVVHADLKVDTTKLNVHELSLLIKSRLNPQEGMRKSISVVVQSFGFKHGSPLDSDYVFDVRNLPNPHWDAQLREFTGLDAPIEAYLEQHPEVLKMLASISQFFETWIPSFMASNRSYLTISIGCTGGRHRSVYIVQKLGKLLQAKFPDAVTVLHREL